MPTCLTALALILVTIFSFTKIAYASSDRGVASQIEVSVQAIRDKQGYPSILNGRDYQTAKEIYELRDKADFATFTYVKDKHGDLHCVALSLGYPMPASVQIANPKKYTGFKNEAGVIVLPQAEANGLFIPEGLAATYQRIINPTTGEVTLGYFEDNIDVYPFEIPTAKTSCAIFKAS